MDDSSKDYMLDTAMASIVAFKKAIEIVNYKHPDKSKRLSPTEKIKYFTEFINNEHDRVITEYETCIKTSADEHSTTEE
jgi:hypothetical protein